MTTAGKIEVFRRLHESGTFVMPNPWDVGSARALEGLGFPALATTSAGCAWSLGKPDNGISLEEALEHLTAIASAVGVPMNADFEGAFAVDPDQVHANVLRATQTGVAGLSVEDSTGDPSQPLYDADFAVQRVRAAREAIDESGTGVVLTARSEGFVVGRPDLEETVRRLRSFAEAGADCLYAPGLDTSEQIAAVVAAVAPRPVNVLIYGPFLTVTDAAALGARRISVGGALARTAWAGFMRAAQEIADHGTFGAFVDLPSVDGLLGPR